jgi:tetratricopeptide (TPR) repeat protein
MVRQGFLALAMAMLALVAPVRAQDVKKDPALEELRQHNAKAKVHYDLGEFEQAANEYILMYRIKAIPAILYNIAQAYRQAGQYEKARQFYKSYLRENPEPKVRAAIEKALKEIDELLAKEKKTREAAPTGVAAAPIPPAKPDSAPAAVAKQEQTPKPQAATPAPLVAAKPAEPAEVPAKPIEPPAKKIEAPAKTVAVAETPATKPSALPPPSASPAKPASAKPAPSLAVTAPPRPAQEVKGGSSHVAAWVLAGTSVALLGGGGLFFTKASSTDSSLQNSTHTRAEADQLISQSKSNHMLSAVLLGAGAAAAVTTVILFVVQ